MIMPVHSPGLSIQINKPDALISLAMIDDVGSVQGALR